MARSRKKRKKNKRGEGKSTAFHTAAICIALFLPLVIYLALMLAVFGAPDSPWLMLGFVGAFAVGIGCAALVSSLFWKLPLGVLGIIPFAVGAILILISSLLMFAPGLKTLLNTEMVSYSFITVGFLAFSLIFYMLFRFSLESWIRRVYRMSNTYIGKAKKGKRNYWWYEALHREVGLGVLYGMNKLYTLLSPAALALTLLTGYFRPMSVPICALVTAVSLLTAAMSVFVYAQHNKEEHGTYVVLLARNSRRGFDSVLFDLCIVLLMLAMAYAHIMITADLWGIELPHL